MLMFLLRPAGSCKPPILLRARLLARSPAVGAGPARPTSRPPTGSTSGCRPATRCAPKPPRTRRHPMERARESRAVRSEKERKRKKERKNVLAYGRHFQPDRLRLKKPKTFPSRPSLAPASTSGVVVEDAMADAVVPVEFIGLAVPLQLRVVLVHLRGRGMRVVVAQQPSRGAASCAARRSRSARPGGPATVPPWPQSSEQRVDAGPAVPSPCLSPTLPTRDPGHIINPASRQDYPVGGCAGPLAAASLGYGVSPSRSGGAA